MENQTKHPLNVVIVDDDYNTVEAFTEFLELKNIKVVGKGFDGNDAVKLYRNLKPDIVFLDVMMPEYDGFYALEKIREINPNAVVIMVTADLTQETEDRLKELKANSIVYKPFDIQQILEVISKLALKCEAAKNLSELRSVSKGDY